MASSKAYIKIGIIGGTGLDNPSILEDQHEEEVETVFGKPSDALLHGKISGVDCVLIARHGRQHTISPTNINYRANIWALKEAGCTHVLASTACGSLKEDIRPGDFILIDSFIDRTTKRELTFYDGKTEGGPKGICHMPMDTPYSAETREILLETAKELGIQCHPTGTSVCIEGPRFSTRAESHLFRQWGASVVNMTTVPEAQLAKEAGLLYAAVAMATDYDCWKDSVNERVNVENVLKTFKENVGKITSVFRRAVTKIEKRDWSQQIADAKELIQHDLM